jgi:hypothetical protein
MLMLHAIEEKAREWILADKEGTMFGVPYTAADLESKTEGLCPVCGKEMYG